MLSLFEHIPNSVAGKIIAFLAPEEVVKLRLVSASDRSVVDSTSYGHLLTAAQKARATTREDFHVLAVAYGSIRVLEWIERTWIPGEDDGSFFHERLCATAARHGDLTVLRWLRERKCPWDATTCVEAARKGRIVALRWARENGCPWGEKVFEEAAAASKREVLEWLYNQSSPCPWDSRSCQRAAQNGDLETLRWLRRRECPWDGNVLYEAARANHEQLLAWAAKNGCPRDERLKSGILEFIGDGDVTILERLYRHDCCPLTVEVCKFAARSNRGHIVQWARERGWSWDAWTFAYAAEYADIATLKWLKANGCPWDERTCAKAALKGRLNVLKWARSQTPPAPWDELTFSWGAWGGQLSVLNWLEKNGCPRNDRLAEYAVDSGSIPAARWARKRKSTDYAEKC